jgi:beta-phosphoglucomutase-like phosphatase (HAD superfamily)
MIKAFLFDFDGVIVDTEVRAFDRLTSFSIRSRS